MSDIEIGSVWKDKDSSGLVEITEVLDGHVRYTWEGERCGWDIASFLQNFEEYTPVSKKIEPQADMVNHPPHYQDASGIECIEVTKHMQFCGGNCFKYLYRAGKKGSTVEDLKKAAWYAERAWIMNEIVSNEVFNKIFDIAHFRLGNIAAAMDSVRFNEWDMVEKHVRAEIARLESE